MVRPMRRRSFLNAAPSRFAKIPTLRIHARAYLAFFYRSRAASVA